MLLTPEELEAEKKRLAEQRKLMVLLMGEEAVAALEAMISSSVDHVVSAMEKHLKENKND